MMLGRIMEFLTHLESGWGVKGWLLAALAAACIGLSKAGFGGFSLVSVLLMATLLPPKESTGMVLPMLIAADMMASGRFRLHADWRELRSLLPATITGLGAGWLLIQWIPQKSFGHFLGGMILTMIVLVICQRWNRRILTVVTLHPGLASFSGFVAGVATMTANAGGPPMTFHLLARRFDKMSFVGTCAWFFLIVNLLKVPLSCSLGLISPGSLLVNLVLLPAVGSGFLAGKFLLGKVPQGPFELLLILMSLGAALKLLFA